MAPSPVLNIEPKGPDKNSEKSLDDVSQRDKQKVPNDNVDSSSKDKSSVESIIDEIGEGELKSLLDEAYNFRSPKDRENTSDLFQKYLNELEKSDAGNKKLIDRSRGFVDGLKAASAIESSHGDSVSEQTFLNNFLGGCGREKKKKKNGKRDGSSSNGSSRRTKFAHQLKINHGPQSSVYNGNGGGGGGAGSGGGNGGGGSSNSINSSSYHGSNRSSSRAQQSLSTRLNTSKATLLTSSSNIDIPMVTTYNKQPIMTTAVVPRKQQKTELVTLDLRNSKASCSSDETSGKNEEIELKSLNEVSGYNYTAHASLEINGSVSKHVDTNEDDNKYSVSTDDTLMSCSAGSSNVLLNGNTEMSLQHSADYKSFNGTLDNKEQDTMNEMDEKKQELLSKKKNKKKECSSTDVVTANGTSSVDETITRNTVLPKNVLNIWTHIPLFILNGVDTSGRVIYSTKEASELRKSGDEGANNYQSKDGSGSGRLKKKKVKQKPDVNSYLSQNIEGYCGGEPINYLLEYINNNRSSGSGGGNANSHSINGTNQKSPRTKPTNGVVSKHEKQAKGKACTDEDIRNKKPVKSKERLKKSSSLEDLRHSRSKSNKKQSSVDESHYVDTRADEIKMRSPSPTPASAPLPVPSTASAPPVKKSVTNETQTAVDDETRFYFDGLIDDNYTETEFHLVTKKQRRKKRRSKSRTANQKTTGRSSMSQDFLPHNYTDRNHDTAAFKRSTRSTEKRHRSRRKSVSSVVPSDKISDSDSIHSLPVSSTTPKCRVKKKSTSSGCTPQASYADIAKSPQCQSSTMLDGEGAAKWQTKTFSNVAIATSSASAGAGDLDNVELVSPTKYEDHVELVDGCDELLLTCSNNVSSNCCSASDSPATSVGNSSLDEVKTSDDTDDVANCSNINDSNNNNTDNDTNISTDVTQVAVTLKRKSKMSKQSNENDNVISVVNNNINNNVNNDNDSNNINNNTNTNTSSYSHVCSNGKLEKSATKEGLNTSTDTNNSSCISNINRCSGNNNHSNNHSVNNVAVATKSSKKSRSKRRSNAEEHEIDTSTKEKNGNDLFIEFTLKCVPTVKTKCSQTQTDLVEVNNNACCNEVSVEETVIVKSSRSGGSSCQDEGSSRMEKLSSVVAVDESDGSRMIVLPKHADGEEKMVSVEFDVNAKLLEQEAVTSDVLKEIVERSSKYNVNEVIQYVNKSWNEVMESLSSATKFSDSTKKQVQYYVAK